MSTEDTALPVEGQSAQEASGQPNAGQLADNQETGQTESVNAEGEKTEGGEKPKAEKTPEERERARMQRGIDRRTRQLAEERAARQALEKQLSELTSRGQSSHNQSTSQGDSEPLTLTREQLAEMVKAEAQKLAPTITEQNAAVEKRKSVVQSLASTWGQERFDELSSDLDDAFGGLTDSSGRPKPAIEAVFEADNPAPLIEYLADPENSDEAEAISRMSPVQAGKAIARLEDKLKSAKAKDKPQPSKLTPPIEPPRGKGGASVAPNPSDTKAWIQWRNEQERAGR